MQTFSYSPIGIVHSCFKDKFGIPRQAGLTPHSTAVLEFYPPYNRPEAWRGIDGFSHLWINFLFHTNLDKQPKLAARPPRLGGEKKMGIFATRSPFHPNFLGQSVVQLEEVITINNNIKLKISGHDLLDRTPIIDIKPYIAEYESIAHATSGWLAQKQFVNIPVIFLPSTQATIEQLHGEYPTLQHLITEMLSLDPRSAQHKRKNPDKIYKIRLYDLDIEWKIVQQHIEVINIHPL